MSEIGVVEGDALEVLGTMPAAAVDAIVTSPPYADQRTYADAKAKWDVELVRLAVDIREAARPCPHCIPISRSSRSTVDDQPAEEGR